MSLNPHCYQGTLISDTRISIIFTDNGMFQLILFFVSLHFKLNNKIIKNKISFWEESPYGKVNSLGSNSLETLWTLKNFVRVRDSALGGF